MPPRHRAGLAACLVTALLTGCAPAVPAVVDPTGAATATTPVSGSPALLAAVGDRLLASEEVAAVKGAEGLPIDDPAREAEVVAAAGAAAADAGVDVARAETVVGAQISASKAAQAAYLALWASGAAVPPADASLDEARTIISAATAAIVAGLPTLSCPLAAGDVAAVAARLAATGLDEATSGDVVAVAVAPLCP